MYMKNSISPIRGITIDIIMPNNVLGSGVVFTILDLVLEVNIVNSSFPLANIQNIFGFTKKTMLIIQQPWPLSSRHHILSLFSYTVQL